MVMVANDRLFLQSSSEPSLVVLLKTSITTSSSYEEEMTITLEVLLGIDSMHE